MSIEQGRDYVCLKQLVDAPDGSVKKFVVNKSDTKSLELTAPAKKEYEASLVSRGYVLAEGKGANKKLAITVAGREYFPKLPSYPPPPVIDQRFKGFIMLNLVATGDARLTLKQVKGLLSPAFAKSLGVTKDAIAPLLDSLLQEHAVEQSATEGPSADDRVSYRLTEAGRRQVAHLPQHVDATFKLTGRTINQLLESAGTGTRGTESATKHPPTQATVEPHRPAATTGTMTDDDLIRDAKSLMGTLGRNGLLPIFELRRHVKRKFGERAAGVDEFDRRLKRLRGTRLDLISLYDPSFFTKDQLSEGVQGVGELFFYVSDLR